MKPNLRDFSSFSTAASGNQTFFAGDPGPMESLVFYRLPFPREGPLTLFFSDSIDSTFADGSYSRAGDTLGGWELLLARAAVTEAPDPALPVREVPVTFCGHEKKTVEAGEWFAGDPVSLPAGSYLRLRLRFQGERLPCLEESLLDSYRLCGGRWVPSVHTPLAALVGSTRPVKARLGFLGDSITQGIGTPAGSYLGFVSQTAALLGGDYAVWNLGLGFARAADAALGGSFLDKARACGHVVLCLGTNDLLQTGDAQKLMADLAQIVQLLERAGTRVFLQTLPPFDYEGDLAEAWRAVNRFILTELGRNRPVLDTVAFLSGERDCQAAYGGHPDPRGCALWAQRLAPRLLEPAFITENAG